MNAQQLAEACAAAMWAEDRASVGLGHDHARNHKALVAQPHRLADRRVQRREQTRLDPGGAGSAVGPVTSPVELRPGRGRGPELR
jgi:hypothetical protein